MKKAEKLTLTEELKENFSSASALFVADYRGITVNDLTRLRFELNKSGTRFKVVKNRLGLRALEPELAKLVEAQWDEMTAVAVVKKDIGGAAKTLVNFAKENDKLKLKGGILDGKPIQASDIKALSNLPSREQLLGQLVGLWNSIPTGFVRVLAAVPTSWVNVLDAVKRKKEGAAS